MTILAGTSSWTDPTLTKDSEFYPAPSMSAEERLRFYASVFPLVEVDATYYAPPAARVVELWVKRTPPGFRMDVKCYSLLTGHPTKRSTLWNDVAADLPPEHAGKANVYAGHLPPEAVERAWAHFGDALRPLADAGKLGAVMVQFPPWFTAKKANRALLESLAGRLPGMQLAIEFRHGSWMGDRDRTTTLSMLKDLRLAYVCVDEPQGLPSSVPPVTAATADLAVVRFHGRNAETWRKANITAAERFRYLYDEDELREWVGPIRQLDGRARETHVLMNNCYRDFGVRNARDLARLLGEGLQPGAG